MILNFIAFYQLAYLSKQIFIKEKTINNNQSLYKNKNLVTILLATTLRGYNLGFLGVFLGIYLYYLGLSNLQFGIALSCFTLSGAISNLFVYFFKNILSRKISLIIMTLSATISGIMLMYTDNYYMILIAAIFSIGSITGGDRTGISSIEIPIISKLVEPKNQTYAYSVYNFLPMISKIIGTSILIIIPVLRSITSLQTKSIYFILLTIYTLINTIQTSTYIFLNKEIESINYEKAKIISTSGSDSKLILIITSLFAIDSFGGGFIARSFISFWLIKSFSLNEGILSIIFILAQILNGISLILAPKIAKKIGILNTMILSQIIANSIIVVAALSTNWIIASILYLIKEAFNDLDIPTRQAFMMNIVSEQNQTQMASISNLGRTGAHTFSPGVAGYVSSIFGINLSLVFGGAIKIIYALILLRFKSITFKKYN
ncbi:MAG: MFS transporter [SAR202 cluster bacterium]|nr:MFS transporter [SAR202 cluster bacterium]